MYAPEGSFGKYPIKLAFDCLGRLPALSGADMKYKCFRFDGQVSMLQLCVLVSRQISTRIDHADTDPSVGHCLNTQSLQRSQQLW